MKLSPTKAILRPPDGLDFSDITASKATGTAYWNDDGTLDIPFDVEPSPAEQRAILVRITTANTNEETLQNRAHAALSANETFLALPTPTNAQVLAQVQRLTKECSGVIRLLLSELDSTSGT